MTLNYTTCLYLLQDNHKTHHKLNLSKKKNDINKEVIDVAFGNGFNATSRVVIVRNPHNKNKTRII